jgi:hypothetical protein
MQVPTLLSFSPFTRARGICYSAPNICFVAARTDGMAIPFVSDGASSSRSAARLLSARVQQANRSMQARAPLTHGVSQQAFKHETGILIAGVMAARVTPIGKIPLGGANFGD